MISFRSWAVHQYKADDKACHDFLHDLKNDRAFHCINTWKALEGYLRDNNASDATLDAARRIWRQYLKATNGRSVTRRGHAY